MEKNLIFTHNQSDFPLIENPDREFPRLLCKLSHDIAMQDTLSMPRGFDNFSGACWRAKCIRLKIYAKRKI